MFELTGKIAVVTGGARGIGKGICEALAKQKAWVVIADLLAEEATATAAEITRSGGKAELGVPYRSLVTLDVPSYSAEACPMCKAGSAPVKPGSRGLK